MIFGSLFIVLSPFLSHLGVCLRMPLITQWPTSSYSSPSLYESLSVWAARGKQISPRLRLAWAETLQWSALKMSSGNKARWWFRRFSPAHTHGSNVGLLKLWHFPPPLLLPSLFLLHCSHSATFWSGSCSLLSGSASWVWDCWSSGGLSLALCSPRAKIEVGTGEDDDLARFTQTHQQMQPLQGKHKSGQTWAHLSFSRLQVKQEERMGAGEETLALPPACCRRVFVFAGGSHATCLWLLMTTAALRSLIFPTHLNTLMIHLYSERSCPCPYASEPIIFAYSSPNNHFLKRNFWQMRGAFSSSGFTEGTPVKNSYLMYLNESSRLFVFLKNDLSLNSDFFLTSLAADIDYSFYHASWKD